MTSKKSTHREKYGKLVKAIGLDYLITLIPVKDIQTLREKFKEDENLNNIPLENWDRAGIPLHSLAQKYQIYNAPYSYVCILKEAAQQWVEEYESMGD